MKIKCPHCSQHVEIVTPETVEDTTCPNCGSGFDFMADTLSHKTLPESIAQGFELLHCVGRGHFGEVWKGRDRTLERIVAIKMPRLAEMDRATVSSFLREARAAAQLRHPTIVAIHDVILEDSRILIISDFIDGVSLAEMMKVRRFSYIEAAELCATIADSLQHAHQSKVIHRDLKPGNILIDGKGVPHLTDFGLAKREGDTITVTADGQVLGTPAYMSPEQAAGKGYCADGRTDIFSLGVILYEMLVGQRPFQGGSQILMHQVIHMEPPVPRSVDKNVPRDLETICLKALSKEPERRYATAAEMAADLRRFIEGKPITARRVSPFERTVRWCRREPMAAAATLAIIILVSSAAGIAWKRHSDQLAALGREQSLQSTIASQDRKRAEALKELDATRRLVPAVRSVSIQSSPPGATFAFIPFSLEGVAPPLERKVQFDSAAAQYVDVPSGPYLVIAQLPNGDFHEVYRYVPLQHETINPSRRDFGKFTLKGDRVELPVVKIPKTEDVLKNMARMNGSEKFSYDDGSTTLPYHVPDFWIDCSETTFGEFRRFWPKHARAKLTEFPDDAPITNLTAEEVLTFAEMCGKTIPTRIQFAFAASNQGTSRFPWGNDVKSISTWDLKGFPFDSLPTTPPVTGLMSGVLEWTSVTPQLILLHPGQSPLVTGFAQVSGGPNAVLSDGPAEIDWNNLHAYNSFGISTLAKNKNLGFRCIRSVKPRFELNDFVHQVQ